MGTKKGGNGKNGMLKCKAKKLDEKKNEMLKCKAKKLDGKNEMRRCKTKKLPAAGVAPTPTRLPKYVKEKAKNRSIDSQGVSSIKYQYKSLKASAAICARGWRDFKLE